MAYQPVQYVIMDEQEAPDNTMAFEAPDNTMAFAASAAVCALAVAGVSMSKHVRANRSADEQAVRACELQYRSRVAEPLMQLQQATAPVGAVQSTGGAPQGVDSSILVQGGSLRTWSYRSPAVEQVQVVLGTEGRPLDADIELWHGPDNTPVKMRVYCENGQLRPFSAVIE